MENQGLLAAGIANTNINSSKLGEIGEINDK